MHQQIQSIRMFNRLMIYKNFLLACYICAAWHKFELIRFVKLNKIENNVQWLGKLFPYVLISSMALTCFCRHSFTCADHLLFRQDSLLFHEIDHMSKVFSFANRLNQGVANIFTSLFIMCIDECWNWTNCSFF